MHLKLWLPYITTAFLQQILLSHQWGEGREIYLSRNLIISSFFPSYTALILLMSTFFCKRLVGNSCV